MVILKSGILYSIITCAFITVSVLYSSFLISLKPKKSDLDISLIRFLDLFALFWATLLLSNVFAWLGIDPAAKGSSYAANLFLIAQPLPLILYFIEKKNALYVFVLLALISYMASLPHSMALTTISYWGVQSRMGPVSMWVFTLGLLLPLFLVALQRTVKDVKNKSNRYFAESISMIFSLLTALSILPSIVTWPLLLTRICFVVIGIISYFYLSGEEATAKFAGRISQWADSRISKIRKKRIPFFVKLVALFTLLSVIPLAAAGALMFLTFKEIIDLYIYKPLLWNLKTSKEEFLVALGNVQLQAILLIILTVILVILASGIASRAIAQSLKRIGRGMKRVEEGDLDYKVEPDSNDEIGDLAIYFNRMSGEIKKSRQIMENWNKELEKTVAERTKDLQTLYNMSKAMGSTLDVGELLGKSLNYIPKAGGSESIAVLLADSDGNLKVRACRNFPGNLELKKDEGIIGSAVNSEQIVKTADISEASEIEKTSLKPFNIKTLLLIPMDNKGKKLGLIVIGVQKEYTPTDIELNLLSTISDQMGIGLENAAIYEKEKETLKKLIEIDNMKTELISMVSHELRTPITSIKGFLSHFISGNTGQTNELQTKFLNIMNKESEHLLSLVDNLLEFSRIEKGGLKSKNEKIRIDELVKGVVEAIEPQLTSRGVDLVLDLKCGEAAFMGDDLRVAQVVKNLIGNSLKFTKENPRIGIATGIKGNELEVRIKDNGIGMDSEQLNKIFNKFYQADSSLTRRFGGMGLGLAISKEIVEAHKGRIWAESEGKDKGSSFIFTLPMIK